MPLERHASRCWRGWSLRRAGLLLALAAAGEGLIMLGLSQVAWPLLLEAAVDVLLLSLWLMAWLPLFTRGERRRFEVLLDTVGAGVYGADEQGRLLFINATGLRLLGRPEDDRSLIGQPLGLLTGDGPPPGVPTHLLRADGTRFEVEAWSRPLPGDDGGHLGHALGPGQGVADAPILQRAQLREREVLGQQRVLEHPADPRRVGEIPRPSPPGSVVGLLALARAMVAPARLLTAYQIHSPNVAVAGAPWPITVPSITTAGAMPQAPRQRASSAQVAQAADLMTASARALRPGMSVTSSIQRSSAATRSGRSPCRWDRNRATWARTGPTSCGR